MALSRQEKARLRKWRKRALVTSILLVGLVIVNLNSPTNMLDCLTATQKDYEELADKMESYIIAEYQRQVELYGEENVNLASIIKDVKRLNTLGLDINYKDSEYLKSVSICKSIDAKVIYLKTIDLK